MLSRHVDASHTPCPPRVPCLTPRPLPPPATRTQSRLSMMSERRLVELHAHCHDALLLLVAWLEITAQQVVDARQTLLGYAPPPLAATLPRLFAVLVAALVRLDPSAAGGCAITTPSKDEARRERVCGEGHGGGGGSGAPASSATWTLEQLQLVFSDASRRLRPLPTLAGLATGCATAPATAGTVADAAIDRGGGGGGERGESSCDSPMPLDIAPSVRAAAGSSSSLSRQLGGAIMRTVVSVREQFGLMATAASPYESAEAPVGLEQPVTLRAFRDVVSWARGD